MHFGEELRTQLVEGVYRQAAGSKEKCIALARQLNEVYAAEKALNEQLSQRGHEDFLRLQKLYELVLAVVLEGKTPALANPDAFFTPEEQASPEFAQAVQAAQAVEPAERKGWWAKTLRAVPIIHDKIEPEDEEALAFLSDVRVSTQPTCMDFSVEFSFEPNPFFSNEVLRVEALHEGGEEIVELRASPIQWKEGRDLTTVTKTSKGRGKGRPKKTVSVKKNSFFLVFSSLRQPEDEEEQDEEEQPAPDAPPTDHEIFYDACDVLGLIRHDLLTCLVPSLLGVPVSILADGPGREGADPTGKPDCKAQ